MARKIIVRLNGKVVKTIDAPEAVSLLDVKKAHVNAVSPAPAKQCQYLGKKLRLVKNELCGCHGRYEQVYRCNFFDEDTTTTLYNSPQPELCCIGCNKGPFSAE